MTGIVIPKNAGDLVGAVKGAMIEVRVEDERVVLVANPVRPFMPDGTPIPPFTMKLSGEQALMLSDMLREAGHRRIISTAKS